MRAKTNVQPVRKMKLIKGDTVMVRSGKFKGTVAKILAVKPKENAVLLEGLNIMKKSVKPSKQNPVGGFVDVHKPLNASKVGIVHPTEKGKTSRIGHVVAKDGSKVRVYRQAGNKEIK
jgi:large subunit ribosomal protein L24